MDADDALSIVYRDGPTGPRAAFRAEPDVREVLRALEDARRAEPALTEDELRAVVEHNTGVGAEMIDAALRCASMHPGG